MSKYVRPEIAAMRGYVPGEQLTGKKIIKLNTNENPFPPSDAAIQAIKATADGGLSRYPDPLGTSFRRRAAEVLGVEPDWILCGNGSDDILTILTRAFVGQGELLRLPSPSYILYRTLAEIQGARYEEVSFSQEWELPSSFGTPTDGLKLVCLPNPNSPSGTVLTPEQILEIAETLPCPLLVDEAYVDFAEQDCVGLVKQSEKILVSRTLSKSYGLAGLRFGFLVAQPQIIAELAKVKDSYNCDALSIAAATAAMNDQDWLAENCRQICQLREFLGKELKRRDFDVTPSQANFVWCQHKQVANSEIFEHLRAQGILVRYMQFAEWGDGLRISVGTQGQMDALFAVMDQILPASKNAS